MQALNQFRNRQIIQSQSQSLNRYLFDQNYTRQVSNHPIHACIGKYLDFDHNHGKKVLELGCGPGRYVAMLTTLGFDVIGVDPCSFPTWDLIREKTSAQILDSISAEDLPFTEDTFDNVVCLGALLYFNNPIKALSEINRVIKPGGKLIIRTVNKNNLYTLNTGKKLDPASSNLYSMDELVNLIERSGFIVQDKFSFGFWPLILTDLWWYFMNVWISEEIQSHLSSMIKSDNRVNNIVIASSLLEK